MELELVGRYEAERTLNVIARRVEHPEVAAPLVNRVLNKEYTQRFQEWDGYMVETGATREAWTDDEATGALRRAHAGSIEYGSTIYYNRFHRSVLLYLSEKTLSEIEEAMASFFVPSGDLRPELTYVKGYDRGDNERVRPYVRGRGPIR